MPANARRRGDNGLNAWPGYVDALSTLLMVIIFVLLVFVLAQAFLSVTLSSRDKQLDEVNRQLAELTSMLSLERSHEATLQAAIAQLNQQVATGNEVRAALAQQLSVARGQAAQASQQLTQATQTRDQLAAELADARARLADATARATSATQQSAEDRKFSDSAKAQLALLAQQVEQLKAQLAAVSQALDLSVKEGRDKDAQITNLGQRLNAALAAKVEELQQYRSEFFGKLRQVLANRPGISVVGDRFVFQSEVLFPVGSADLTPAGVAQINTLADTIRQIMPEIPKNIPWILRVDGHTDSQPIKGGPFASNWELSAARAITVVKLLISDGVPPEHLAATGFSDYQPLDTANTPEAYAKNRRIELRLTDR